MATLAESKTLTFQSSSNSILTPLEVGLQFRGPQGQVQVQGIVSRVAAPSNSTVVGDLIYGNGIIGFEIPEDQAPALHAPIVLKGTLRLKHRNIQGNAFQYQPYITGTVAGTFEPGAQSSQMAMSRQAARKPLARWFTAEAARTPAKLLILASKTAHADISKALDAADAGVDTALKIEHQELNFHPANKTAVQIAEAVTTIRPDLIIIARSGGDPLEIGVAANSVVVVKALLDTGVPFYSAVGHEHDVTLLDKYSDESFHTPSAIAEAMLSHAQDLARERRFAENFKTLQRDLGDTRTTLQNTEEQVTQLKAEQIQLKTDHVQFQVERRQLEAEQAQLETRHEQLAAKHATARKAAWALGIVLAACIALVAYVAYVGMT